MKKLSIFFACLVAVLGFSSCQEDTDPQYQNPTQFVLNTPALANQLYELTEDGTIDLSWSQPDYGYAATAKYKVQVSLDGVDSTYVECNTIYTTCYAQIKMKEIAEAICILRGIESEDDYTDEPARKLYVRVHSYIAGVEGSDIISNAVVLNQVKEYCAIQSPGYIYLIGNEHNWIGPDAGNAAALADWRLFESPTAIGSRIYSGVFNFSPSTNFYDENGNLLGVLFRFYTELTGWDGGASVGLQAEDNPVTVTLTDGAYNGNLVSPGKGSIQILDWQGGSIKITVNLNNSTVILEAGGVDTNGKKFIYLVGTPTGWADPLEANAAHYENYKLYDLEDNGVYTGTFDIEPNENGVYFRFYESLAGWGNDGELPSFGPAAKDGENTEIVYDANGTFSGTGTPGKGSWFFPATWTGGRVAMEVDMVNYKVTFTQK